MAELDNFIKNFRESVLQQVGADFRERSVEGLPFWAVVGESADGSPQVFIPPELPIHWLKRQSELRPLRGQKVVLSNGEVVPRGFHNPVIEGNTYIVAWQRTGPKRKPIKYVYDRTLPYLMEALDQLYDN